MALKIYKVTTGKYAGQWRWHTKSGSDVTSEGGESYINHGDLEKGILSALKDILESETPGVLEAVLEYVEKAAEEGILILPGDNGGLIGQKPSVEIGNSVAAFAKNWRPRNH
mgnify:CR=1 FL=1